MVNSAYINSIQSKHLNKAISDLYNVKQKEYENPDTGLAYKAPTWDKLDVRGIREIINVEKTKACLDSEASRLMDVCDHLATIINVLDSIQMIVVKVQEELNQYDSNNRITRLDSLKHIAFNALKSVVMLCNFKSSNGDYVLSGSQVRIKPLDEYTLNYQGGTDDMSINLGGQLVGEIKVRVDNIAISSILYSLKKIATDKNVVPNAENKILGEAFNEVIRSRLEVAMLLQKVEYLKDKYQIDQSNLLVTHKNIASQNDVQYATELKKKEHAYNKALGITKRFQEIFNEDKGL